MKTILTLIIIVFFAASTQSCAPILVAGSVAGAGAKIAADRRNPESIIKDEAIEIQATDYIYSNSEFGKKVRIEVTAFNGVVLLSGESPKAAYKESIVQRIGRMKPVTKVIDNISVKQKLSFGSRSKDFWIARKVRSKLMFKKGLFTRTKVVTSDKKVYLMGLVSNTEAQELISFVKQVNGIAEVVPLFESLDGTLDPSLQATARIALKPTTKIAPIKTQEQRIQEEDEFIVKPYVLQAPLSFVDEP